MTQNETWLDEFHALHPDRPLGISEYGAEGIISYHSDAPRCRDYTEEYQALYHEHMAKIIQERPWLWATHVWNMFDFGCDSRDEGGVAGRNNKGLMTIDRRIRKDAFYVYKASWSEAGFVHLCGRRYAQRTGDETTVKVYSNLTQVELYVNGELFATQEGNKVFVFEHVPLRDGFTFIGARAGGCFESITLERVEQPNPAYQYIDPDETGDEEGAANWFTLAEAPEVNEIVVREGCFSVKDKVKDVLASDEASDVLVQFLQASMKMKLKKSMLGMAAAMMGEKTLEEMTSFAGGMGGGKVDPEQAQAMLIRLNEALSKIRK